MDMAQQHYTHAELHRLYDMIGVRFHEKDGWVFYPLGDPNIEAAFALNATRIAVGPTPREQELEAQNKALWELVVQSQSAIKGLITYNGMLSATKPAKVKAFIKALDILEEIQKAKEAR